MNIIHTVFVGDSITTDRLYELKNIMYTVDKFNTYRAGYNSNTDNPVCNTKIELTPEALKYLRIGETFQQMMSDNKGTPPSGKK